MSKRIAKDNVYITVGTGIQPKIFSLPDKVRFPTFFVDFPLLKSGIRHLISDNPIKIRYSANKDLSIISAVKNPLRPASLKLLMLLIAQKELLIWMKVREVMRIVAKNAASSSRDLDRYIQDIQNVRISLTFAEEYLIPKNLRPFFPAVKAKDGEIVRRLRDMIIISSVGESQRIERRARDIKINFSLEFMSIYNSFSLDDGYIKLDVAVLKELTNKYAEELLAYMLAQKPQAKHSKDYLTLYFLGCSQEFLVKKMHEEKIKVVDKEIRKIYSRSIKGFEKLKELGVIKDFSYTEGRLRLGNGGRTVPFFETLTIVKNPQQEKGGRSHE